MELNLSNCDKVDPRLYEFTKDQSIQLRINDILMPQIP
jgi:hypothetical protein